MDKVLIINNLNSNINSRKATIGAELDLVENFIDYKLNAFKHKKNDIVNLAIFREIKIDNAYPDIILAEYDESNYQNWNESREILDKQDLKILYHLYYTEGISSNDLFRQLGLSSTILLKSVEKLLDANMIQRKNSLWCIKGFDNFFAVKKIESVEAKINKWDCALKQALLNTRFSSESYVLSKLKNEPLQNTVDKFNGFGIGMYLRNNNGFRKISKSKSNSIPNSYVSLLIGEMIGHSINY